MAKRQPQRTLVNRGKLMTLLEIAQLTPGEYDIEDHCVTTVKGDTVTQTVKYRVWRVG